MVAKRVVRVERGKRVLIAFVLAADFDRRREQPLKRVGVEERPPRRARRTDRVGDRRLLFVRAKGDVREAWRGHEDADRFERGRGS